MPAGPTLLWPERDGFELRCGSGRARRHSYTTLSIIGGLLALAVIPFGSTLGEVGAAFQDELFAPNPDSICQDSSS
ncbi:hypothetical protein GCM10010168_24050 [Actinoplanes ianthinogenes]|uniref:Uncharacterized protein n=1 Tax=Actinoplanes ianthinogenes TaxID=122358 RepID=A0ABN6CS33_9ACTN|nr:hypothetical protein Aiant_87020 [Actinoplanes ianthinogenes]GGR06007.1 hypothetical protein GCM10010168_24050 [Actinoplanes ianthinogenes]